MNTHHFLRGPDAEGARNAAGARPVTPDVIRCVVVLEDSDTIREQIAEKLRDAYWVVIQTDHWETCREWAERLVRIFILDIVIHEDRSAGLKALDAIKTVAPDSFCAVVTEDNRRLAGVAQNLKADHICGKSDPELGELIAKLEHWSAEQGERARATQCGQELTELMREIDTLLATGTSAAAEDGLVRLEVPLRHAFQLQSLGDNFLMVISALHLSLVNAASGSLTRTRWDVWKQVAAETFAALSLHTDQAIDLTTRLEQGGWNTEPPEFGPLAGFLLDGPEQ